MRPQGVHHGAPEKARERARRKFDDYSRVDWSVIAIDTRRRPRAVRRSVGERSRSGSSRDIEQEPALMTVITEAPVKNEYDRIPYLVAYQNTSGVRDVYGGVAELVVLESYLLKPKTSAGPLPSDTVLVFMHPIGGGAYLPMIKRAGPCGPSRHLLQQPVSAAPTSALLMEKVVEDLGECIKDAKNRLGYEKVVLAGWSGGGSLSVFYQQQAQHPTVTASPSGDGPDLTKLGLIPADGIMLLAAHISRHGTMTEWLDASILDESDPSKRDPELDLYNPGQPRNQPPYTAEFPWTATGRHRSRATGESPSGSKKNWRSSPKQAGPDDEFGFVVHGTMADPRWAGPDGRSERFAPQAPAIWVILRW